MTAATRRAVAVCAVAMVMVAGCSSGTTTGPSAPAGSAPGAGPGAAPAGPTYHGFAAVGPDRPDSSDTRITNGPTTTVIAWAPLHIQSATEAGPFFAEPAANGGLYVVRGGQVHRTVKGEPTKLDTSGVEANVTFDDGTTGKLRITGASDFTIQIALTPDDPTGVTEWGETIATPADEMIYGLTERIVDDYGASELVIQEVGSLDRKGEKVTMYIRPTMSGYVPFHQSSKGYGLLVDGAMPGWYDVAATDPAVIDLRFELDAQHRTGSFHLIFGPGHPQILDEYTSLTGRPFVPPPQVFGHWRGRDVYPAGETADWHGLQINATVALDLNAYEQYGIPPGIFHWDRPWAVGAEGYGDFRFDPVQFPNAVEMLKRMKEAGWRHEVWVSPWAIDAVGEEAKAKGYLGPNSPRALDLTNPDAVAWQTERLVDFLRGPEGMYVDGFFLDRGEEGDVKSTVDDIYHNGQTGRALHNEYVLLYEKAYRDAMDQARPDGSGWLIARPGYTGSQQWVMRWGGDTPSREGFTIPEVTTTTPSTDLGLRSVCISMQRAAFMGTPYWGSDIGGYSQWIDPDLYQRWIEIGAASPLMRFHGQGGTPWKMSDGSFSQEALDVYERYVALHHSMQPYYSKLAQEAHDTGNTIVRPLVFTWPDEPGARNRWDEWMIGPDVLVAPVWKSGQRSREVWFPPGRWVDEWRRSEVIEGPVTKTIDVPLDVLPMYLREGSDLLQIPAPA